MRLVIYGDFKALAPQARSRARRRLTVGAPIVRWRFSPAAALHGDSVRSLVSPATLSGQQDPPARGQVREMSGSGGSKAFRICLLASIVALCATTLTVANAGDTARGHRATEATATTRSPTPRLAEPARRHRADGGSRPGLMVGPLFTRFEGPVGFSPGAGQDRAYRLVLLDGSDRWRALLLGAPPLLA